MVLFGCSLFCLVLCDILTCYLFFSTCLIPYSDNREFVGQLKYGAVYKLWNPQENLSFGGSFRTAARILFMCQRRAESPFSKLPDDCLFFILNMMRWDWVNDTSVEMRREQKQRRRLRRQEMIQEADAIMDENNSHADANEVAGAEDDDDDDAQVGGDEEDLDFMDEDSSDDSEDADTSDSDDDDSDVDDEESSEEEYRWGDHVGSRSAFHFNADDSSDSEDSESDHERDEHARRIAIMRARRNILSFLRSH